LELFYRYKRNKWTAEWSFLRHSHWHYEGNWKSHATVAVRCKTDIRRAKPSAATTWPRQWPLHAVDQCSWKASCTHPRARLSTVFCRMPAPSGGTVQHLPTSLVVNIHCMICLNVVNNFWLIIFCYANCAEWVGDWLINIMFYNKCGF